MQDSQAHTNNVPSAPNPILQQYGIALHQMADAVVVMDPDGVIRYVNPAFERQSGWSAADVVGRRLDVLIPHLSPAMWGTTRTGQPWRGVAHCLRPDNTAYDADLMITPVTDERNRLRHLICVQRDILPLREQQVLKARFTTKSLDELRHPLTRMRVYHNLLRRGRPDKQDAYMQTLENQMADLERHIDDLLNLWRLDLQNADRLKCHPIDLNSLVRQTAERFYQLAASRQLTLEQALDCTLPPVNADAGLIIEALTQLVGGAVASTPAGRRVLLRTAVVRREGCPYAAVTVADAGYDNAPEPESSPPTSPAPGAPYTEAGRAMVRQIAYLHHGHVEIQNESVPGGGGAFTLMLPISDGGDE